MNSPLSTLARQQEALGPLKLGSRLRKYEIRQLVGQGGYASVYRARDTILKRDVAIKVIHRIGGVTDDMLRRGQAEAVFLNKTRHPGIVEVYDADVTDGGLFYIVMELLVGRSLHDVLHEHRRLAVEEALSLVVQVADAVNAAHQLGAIHRDLKPENIFVLSGNTTKILDFGIAKFVNDVGAKTTAKDALQGSVLYMSPEHVQGIKVGTRTDIYALGIILYRALLGEHPVLMDIKQPATAWSVATWHVEKMPQPLCDIAPWVPSYVSRFVSSACAKKPERRPESMEAVARQARALLKRFLAETKGELKGQTRDLSCPTPPTETNSPATPPAAPALAESPAPALAESRSVHAPQPLVVSNNPSRVLGDMGLHGAVTCPVNDRTIPGMGFRPVPAIEQSYGASQQHQAVPVEPLQNQSVEPRTVASAEQRQRAAITDLSLVSSTGLTNAVPPAGAPSAQEARNARQHAAAKRLFIGAAVSGALFFGSLTSAYLAHRRHVVRAPVVQDVIAVATASPMLSARSPGLRSAPAPSVGVTAPEETNILTAVALAKEPAVSVSAQPTITTKPSAEQTLAIPKPSAVTPPRQAASKAKKLSPSDLRIKALEEELARRQRAKSTSPMRSAFQPQ